MSKKLEQFVKDNREDFDKFEPGPVVWHNIQQELKKPQEKKGILISMKVLRWSAAAAVLIILGAAVYYYNSNSNSKKEQEIAGAKKTQKTNDLPVVTTHDSIKETPTLPQNKESNKPDDTQLAKNNNNSDEAEYNEELGHLARLVELKQNQIMKIKKDEPLLYQKFAGDINKLDSTFHTLKKQLPANPNREQILEAMIQNLQFQEALLNQQLNIIKKINHTKKTEYEKAYRSA
jgi:hypothetical protein